MIDLDKYGIGHLKYKQVRVWDDDDFAKLFDAIASEGAAPVVDLPFIAENIEALLSVSNCRQCGNCCRTGIMEDENASVMVSKTEIEAIAAETNTSFGQLTDELAKHPTQQDAWCFPLPCMFYQDGKCQIYDVRPNVCYTYPLTGVACDDITYIAIDLRCDYGRDIYECVLRG